MRIVSILTAACAFALPALAGAAPEEPETITIRSVFGETEEVKPDWAEIRKHKLGSPGNPVRCDGPMGERVYLSRLRCPGGAGAAFERRGSAGRSPFGGIVDIYDVSCPPSDGMKPQAAYMDMYHPGYQEKRPLPGFSIVPPVEMVHPKTE